MHYYSSPFRYVGKSFNVVINSRYYYVLLIINNEKYLYKCSRQNLGITFEILLQNFYSYKVLDVKQEGHPKAKLYKKLVKQGKIKEIVVNEEGSEMYYAISSPNK